MQRALHIVWGFDDLEPQVKICVGGATYWADFADRKRKILVECEGSTHRTSSALSWDARRFSALALDGWLILRFTWAHVVHDPMYVVSAIRAAYAPA
jgi:very-short-patch-repair endonuclease